VTSHSRIEQEEIKMKDTSASNCKDAQFQQQCAKGKMGMESYHYSQKFAQARRYLPKVTRIIFFKTNKKWGVFQQYA
jgi:hypothetical protein